MNEVLHLWCVFTTPVVTTTHHALTAGVYDHRLPIRSIRNGPSRGFSDTKEKIVVTSPSVSSVKEKIIRERTVSPEELAKEKSGTMPDCFEYIERLKAEDWGDHIAYLYRDEPKASTWPGAPPAYLDKFVGSIEVRPGYSVTMDDAGTIQQAVKEKFGGRVFRLILKKGRERITECRFTNEAPPKYPDAQNQQPQYHQQPNGATDASVASKAIDAMASQQPDAVRLAMDVLRSASEIVMRQANPQQPHVTTESELDRAIRQATIQRLLAPPPDPFEMFVKFKQLMGDGGGMAGNPLIDKVLSAAVDKILNPAPAISGRTTLLDIGREFIPVLGTVMHEYRLSREADARITELQRSAMPPPAAVQQNPPALPAAPLPAPVPQQATPPAAPALTFQQIENHIAKIVKNVAFPVDEAVDKVLEFLYDTDPRIVGALLNPPSLDPRLKPGKDGLMQLFTFEPELKDCLANVPRLSEFLDKFIIAATEAEAAEARLRSAAPAATAAQPV